jgi:hypothetical protein
MNLGDMAIEVIVPGDNSSAEGQLAMDTLAESLVQINEQWLRTHPETPNLYDSGVYYDLRADVQRPWQSIPRLYRMGRGDCEDIAAARTAELRVRHGIDARMCNQHWDHAWDASVEGGWGTHWLVCLPDGTVEDPSSKLSRGTPKVTLRAKRVALAIGAATVVGVVAILTTGRKRKR